MVQAQQTAYRAATDLGERLADRAPDGSDLPTATFNIHPRSYLIAGRLTELLGEGGGVHLERF